VPEQSSATNPVANAAPLQVVATPKVEPPKGPPPELKSDGLPSQKPASPPSKTTTPSSASIPVPPGDAAPSVSEAEPKCNVDCYIRLATSGKYVCRKCSEMHTISLNEYRHHLDVRRHFAFDCQYGPSSTPPSIRTSPPPASPPKKSNSPPSAKLPTETKERVWIPLSTSDYICRECHRHNEPLLKHYGLPERVVTHFESECKYGPSSIAQSPSISPRSTSLSESESSTTSPVLVPDGPLPRWQSQSIKLSWLGLRPNRFVCKECFRHDEKDLVIYETSRPATDHFRTECKYGPSFLAKYPDFPSSLSSKWEYQPFDFNDHDSLTDLQFRRKFFCERSDYPVAIELDNEDKLLPRHRKRWTRWTCRHCKENGVPLVTWSNEGNVLNHWNERCRYNLRRKQGSSKGPEPVVQGESQVCPALGYANW
jgi:hypothetical protein